MLLQLGKYAVGFEDRYHERFRDREEALDWARSVAATGRRVWVIKGRFLPELIAVFPVDEYEKGKEMWDKHQGPKSDLGALLADLIWP